MCYKNAYPRKAICTLPDVLHARDTLALKTCCNQEKANRLSYDMFLFYTQQTDRQIAYMNMHGQRFYSHLLDHLCICFQCIRCQRFYFDSFRNISLFISIMMISYIDNSVAAFISLSFSVSCSLINDLKSGSSKN